ncbi:unnamed protein product [Calypogeia fissa]
MSSVLELNESGTNETDHLEKAKIIYQQISKKNQEFTYEGAWRILNDSPKWQSAQSLNEKNVERAAKRKKKQLADSQASPTVDQENSQPKLKKSKSPKMVTDRPIGNKKAKALDALDKKLNKQNIALQSASDNIASALNRRATALEAGVELKIWMTDIKKCSEGVEAEAPTCRMKIDAGIGEQFHHHIQAWSCSNHFQ